MTSAPLPRSVRHIVPRRGYVLSCFTWTIRLGMIVEDILDLEMIGPPVVESFDRQFVDRLHAMRDPVSDAEGIAEQLRQWRQSLPKHLEVDSGSGVSPLPHHIVGLSVSDMISTADALTAVVGYRLDPAVLTLHASSTTGELASDRTGRHDGTSPPSMLRKRASSSGHASTP